MKHIVFDRQRCDVECGMGLEFLELNESQKSLLNLQILNDQSAYMELRRILSTPEPDSHEMTIYLKKLPFLQGHDLLQLRYRVNRICTIFEPASDPFEEDNKAGMVA